MLSKKEKLRIEKKRRRDTVLYLVFYIEGILNKRYWLRKGKKKYALVFKEIHVSLQKLTRGTIENSC